MSEEARRKRFKIEKAVASFLMVFGLITLFLEYAVLGYPCTVIGAAWRILIRWRYA
jgi:uncharacterized membrane protein